MPIIRVRYKVARPSASWLCLRRPLSAPEHASGCPKLRPASANPPLGPRWPAIQALVFEIGARAGAKDAKGRTPLLLARQLDRGKGDAKLLSMLEYSIQAQAPAVPMGHGGLV